MDHTKLLFVMRGLPGSGKSTVVNDHILQEDEFNFQVVCQDDVRSALGISHNGEGWTPEKEDKVKDVTNNQLLALMKRGLDIVVDETNTTLKKLYQFQELADIYGYCMLVVWVDTPVETCKERRVSQGFPEEVIDRMDATMELSEEEFKQNFNYTRLTEEDI